MKDNIKTNLKILGSSIVIIFCVLAAVREQSVSIGGRDINLRNMCLLVLIVASAYFGIIFERRNKSEIKGEEIKNEEVIPSDENIPEEFREEERKFSRLNKKGMLE